MFLGKTRIPGCAGIVKMALNYQFFSFHTEMSRLPIKESYFGVWSANDFVGGLAIGNCDRSNSKPIYLRQDYTWYNVTVAGYIYIELLPWIRRLEPNTIDSVLPKWREPFPYGFKFGGEMLLNYSTMSACYKSRIIPIQNKFALDCRRHVIDVD